MKLVAFTLGMPNKGSWNGKWTGEDNLYCRVKRFRNDEKVPELKEYWYSWGDGWAAEVVAKEVFGKEAQSLRKRSKGFAGYDWMIDSIIKCGEIKNSKGW